MLKSTPLHEIERQLRRDFPSALIAIDFPENENGIWYLDVKYRDKWIIVQWHKSENKFGLSFSLGSLYTHKPDRVFYNLDLVYIQLVLELIKKSSTHAYA